MGTIGESRWNKRWREKKIYKIIQVDELGEIGNTLIDKIRSLLTINAQDLENSEEYGHYTKIELNEPFN